MVIYEYFDVSVWIDEINTFKNLSKSRTNFFIILLVAHDETLQGVLKHKYPFFVLVLDMLEVLEQGRGVDSELFIEVVDLRLIGSLSVLANDGNLL